MAKDFGLGFLNGWLLNTNYFRILISFAILLIEIAKETKKKFCGHWDSINGPAEPAN